MRFTFDTNILVYATDSRSGRKHTLAVDLMDRAGSADCVLTLQALGEFYNIATGRIGLDPGEAGRIIDAWRSAFPVHAAGENCLTDAMGAVVRHRLAFWDAMLWATAREAGCRILLTGDLQDRRDLDGLRFVNPFLAANHVLLDAAFPPAGG